MNGRVLVTEALRGSKKKLVSDDFLADTIEARQATCSKPAPNPTRRRLEQ